MVDVSAVVRQASERVGAAAPRLGMTRMVCVDGPAGSGKTSLAAELAASFAEHGLSTEVLHMDDLYEGWTGLNADLERRLRAQVMEPLSRGVAARWQRYDWAAGRFDGWQEFPRCDVLVLEGCGSGARAYASYRSLLVWVEASRELRLVRGVQRDGEGVGSHWRRWMQVEAAHFTANHTRFHADLVLVTG